MKFLDYEYIIFEHMIELGCPKYKLQEEIINNINYLPILRKEADYHDERLTILNSNYICNKSHKYNK
jgi:hypothetical protein